MGSDRLPQPAGPRSLYLWLTLIIQGLLAVELALFILRRDWENVFLTATVIALTLLPALARRRWHVDVPPEFQLASAAFASLSLYLGSARDFYYRFWWWDMALHAGSGFLLGMVGFLALFVLNQTEHVPLGVRRGFVSFFGVVFALAIGLLWEIFEFAVDSFAPAVNMQSRETGVVDTMHDLIVSTAGAVAVGFLGWAYSRTGRYSFVADVAYKFVRMNPRLFRGGPGRTR